MGKIRAETSILEFEERFKKPINNIFDCVTKLEVTCTDATAANYTQMIKDCNLQLLRSSKMIAEHARLVNHLYPHKRQKIDLVRYVRGIARAAAPYAFRNGISFSYHIPREPIITITETAPLTAILGHLLSNACRFKKPDDAIFVDMCRKGENIFILVWDRGRGFPHLWRRISLSRTILSVPMALPLWGPAWA